MQENKNEMPLPIQQTKVDQPLTDKERNEIVNRLISGEGYVEWKLSNTLE